MSSVVLRETPIVRVGTVRHTVTPTQQPAAGPLFEYTTARRQLLKAWLDVRPRVINSKDAETKAGAGTFAQDAEKSLRTLQRELRAGTFTFAPQRGVLKKRKSAAGQPKKQPRPIVVAPVLNRIVQRAILDTCQYPEKKIIRRLGELPRVIATETSVGGLPGRGVVDAVQLISGTISGGAKWFVRSDLKNFFQAINKEHVEAFLRSNIRDTRFISLFMTALQTELSNEAEVRDLIHLFPMGPVGVPQGSALSALCANIVLHDFDCELNKRGIRTIRYLDDFLILGGSKRAVTKAWERGQAILKAKGLECHDPEARTGKASMGEVAQGFEFLSFHIDDKVAYPSDEARAKFLEDVRSLIRIAKRSIASVKDETRRAEPRFVQSLNLIDNKIRGWGDAFQATTMRVVLAQMDAEINTMVDEYINWFRRLVLGKQAGYRQRLRGVALLRDALPSKPLANRQ